VNYFWTNLFEYAKERRNAMLFLVSFALLPLVLLLGFFGWQAAAALDLAAHWPLALPGIGLIAFALARFRVRKQRLRRLRRLNRYKSSPLSRDEKAKARSKLIRTKS
jgi:hypothetical protein